MGKKSRQKAERRAAKFRCVHCGMQLARRHADAAEAMLAGMKVPGRVEVVHVCGQCRTPQVETPEGSLRRMTDAERFEFEYDCGEEMELAARGGFPADGGATLILPRKFFGPGVGS